jgi:hypothetical protein
MKTYSQLSASFQKSIPKEEINETREQYLNGDLFSVGDIVLDKKERTLHEIVNLGTNYVTVVDETGQTSKKWITDLIEANSLEADFNELRRKRSSSNQVAFLGYKTKNFNEEHYHLFMPLVKKYRTEDKFAVLSLLRASDELIAESSEISLDNYTRIQSLYEQTEKLLVKFNSLSSHLYRQNIMESILYVELTEGLKFTRGDKQHASKLIAITLGVDANGHPHDVINRAAEHIIKNPKNDLYMAIAKRLFDYAKAMGVKFNHEKLLDKIK